MMVDTAAISKSGGRLENQDRFCITQTQAAYCLAVADGVGGSQHGEFASSLAIQLVQNLFASEPIVSAEVVQLHFKRIAESIMQVANQQDSLRGMNTTLAMVYGDKTALIGAHAGDSRIYTFREGNIVYQSKDHSFVMESQPCDTWALPDVRQMKERNLITSALGRQTPKHIAYHLLSPLEKNRDGIIICTDGFWELVLESEMVACLQLASSAKNWLDRMEQILGNRLTIKSDNYTCVAAMVR